MKEEQVCQECKGDGFVGFEPSGAIIFCPTCKGLAPQSVPVDEGVEA